MISPDRPDMIEGFKNGDHNAIAYIVDHYYPLLLNFLIRMGCPKQDVDDIIQESIIKAAQGLQKGYQHRERFRAWLFCITANTCKDYLKRASNRREIPTARDELPSAHIPGPEESLLEKDAAMRVQRSLQGLPEPQRLCLILRYYHGFSIQEIADAARVPPGTVKSRIHAALQQLKSELKEVQKE